MLWVDIAILVLIAVSAAVSIFRGLMREVLSLLAWITAFGVAIAFYRDVSAVLEDHVSADPSLRLTASFLILFIGALLVSGTVNWIIMKLMAKTGLSGTDRVLGSIFGILRGLIIIQVLVLLAGFLPVPQDPWWQNSLLLQHFERGAEWIVAWLDLPEYFADRFGYSQVQE